MENVNLEEQNNNNKNNKNKNKNNIIVVLCILWGIFLVIISALVMVIFFRDNKGNNNTSDDKSSIVGGNSENDVNNITGEGGIISIDEAEVNRLYNLASASINNYNIFDKEKVLVSELSNSKRNELVKAIYSDKLVKTGSDWNTTYSIDEQYVKDAYDSFYGEGYYNSANDASCGLCCTMKYDATSKKYVGTQGSCGAEIGDTYLEEVIASKTYEDRLEITTSFVFASWNGDALNFEYFRDVNKNVNLGWGTISLEDARSKQKTSADSLQQFTYVFKLNNGQYNYYGVYRTKD